MEVWCEYLDKEEGQRRGLIPRQSAMLASFEYLDTEEAGFLLFNNTQTTAVEYAQVAP